MKSSGSSLTGSFTSHDDVLRKALAAIRFREEEVLAIQQGIDDMEAGRVMPLREFDREFRRRNGLDLMGTSAVQ